MGRVPERLIRTRSDEIAVEQGCWFDQQAADRVRFFFRRFLRHSKGQWAGKPFELLPWQWNDVVEPLFGWKMPDGTRRFRRAGIAVPKKNGKSTLLAGLALYLLTSDDEPGAEIYSAAADRKQASIIFNEAVAMVRASDALIARLHVKETTKEVKYPKQNAWYQALSADVPTKDGLNIHALLFDELHTQPSDKLWNTLRYGGASRRQPVIFWITTAGVDRMSLCYRQWQYALSVREGRAVDVSFLPVIYAADERLDWTGEEAFRQANPSYGETISRRDYEEAAAEAKNSAVEENNYRRYRLNQWVGQETRWLQMVKWDACAGRFTQDNQKRQPCVFGLDLSTTTDLTAGVAWFKEGLKHRLIPYFWLPEAALRTRERENRTRLDHWARQGLIKLTPGDVIDYGIVRADINSLGDLFRIKEVAIDPWNATQIATDLQGDGFEVVYVRTGFLSISAATKEFEKLVLGGQLEHPAHPVLDWMVSNVGVETDASGNLKPSKRRSAEKIDGVVAAILALARIILTPPKKPSKYEKQGLESL